MDYAAKEQVLGSLGSQAVGSRIGAADLSNIREQIDAAIERVRSARHRLTDIADGLFGSRPEPVIESAKATAEAPTIVGMVRDLNREIDALQSQTQRF